MFKIIGKLGGRKMFIILFSCLILLVGYFIMQNNIEHYKIFGGSVVAIATGYIIGNAASHKYNNRENPYNY